MVSGVCAFSPFELDKKSTVVYNFDVQNVRQSYKQQWIFCQAHKISDECIACGACIEECPVEAIAEGDPIYTINAETCTDCGACVDVCPVTAIAEG